MAQLIGSGGIRHSGIYIEDAAFPFALVNTIVLADVGKAMSVEVSEDCTAKLAEDGERIIGKLQTFEDRIQESVKVGTVLLAGGFQYEYTGTVNIGDSIVGSATAGLVRAAATATQAEMNASRGNIVTAVDATNKTCQVLTF